MDNEEFFRGRASERRQMELRLRFLLETSYEMRQALGVDEVEWVQLVGGPDVISDMIYRFLSAVRILEKADAACAAEFSRVASYADWRRLYSDGAKGG